MRTTRSRRRSFSSFEFEAAMRDMRNHRSPEKRLMDEMLALLKRYRNETPLGHQPHMIAQEADMLIAKVEARHG